MRRSCLVLGRAPTWRRRACAPSFRCPRPPRPPRPRPRRRGCNAASVFCTICVSWLLRADCGKIQCVIRGVGLRRRRCNGGAGGGRLRRCPRRVGGPGHRAHSAHGGADRGRVVAAAVVGPAAVALPPHVAGRLLERFPLFRVDLDLVGLAGQTPHARGVLVSGRSAPHGSPGRRRTRRLFSEVSCALSLRRRCRSASKTATE